VDPAAGADSKYPIGKPGAKIIQIKPTTRTMQIRMMGFKNFTKS
jgi:hypothetical protein